MTYKNPPNMIKVGAVVLPIFLAIWATQIISFHQANVYPVDQIADRIELAAVTTNVEQKTLYLYDGLDRLQPYNNNPAALFPTDYTNFAEIKRSLSQVIDETSSLAIKTTNADMASQQYVGNVNSAIVRIHDRIHDAAGAIGFNPTLNPIGYIIGISTLAMPLVLIVVDRIVQDQFYRKARLA